MLIINQIYLALDRKLSMMGFAIADRVPQYDIGLLCDSKLPIFYQRQLLLHGQLPTTGSVTTGNVLVYDIILSYNSYMLIINQIY